MKTLRRNNREVTISLKDFLTFLDASTYEAKIFDDHIEIEELGYEKSVERAYERAKSSPDSDFVNL